MKFQRIILSGLLAVLGLVFVACGNSSTPESVVVSYVESVAAGDAKKVLAFVDTSSAQGDAQEKVAESKVSVLVEASKAEIDSAGGLKEVVVLSKKEEENDKVKVEVEIRLNDGTNKIETIDFVKVKGDWKVSL